MIPLGLSADAGTFTHLSLISSQVYVFDTVGTASGSGVGVDVISSESLKLSPGPWLI